MSVIPIRQRKPFVWDTQKAEIALRIFEGRWSYNKIAAMMNISPRTLDDWIAHPDFQARLGAMRETFA